MNYAIILAGGSGRRFWPLSRKRLPKQFLKIIEKQSLMEATVRRIRKIISEHNIFIVTNTIYLKEIERQLRRFNIPRENIILEPSPKNTLPAIALCAQMIKLRDPEANLLVSPSDHYIKDSDSFKATAVKALGLAKQDFLCLMGIKPDSPRSGYGYIQAGGKIGKDAFVVAHFKEKPKSTRAIKIFKRKGIFWNSGIFSFKAGVILNEIKNYLPDLYFQVTKIKQKQDIINIWPKIKSVSIDYGILEKSKKLGMVAAKFCWSDLGSWDALGDILPRDSKNNNVVLSDSDWVSLGSNNTLVCSYGCKRLIAAVGLKDLIIVDTPDALLVCKKDKAQEIKNLVGILKKKRKTCV